MSYWVDFYDLNSRYGDLRAFGINDDYIQVFPHKSCVAAWYPMQDIHLSEFNRSEANSRRVMLYHPPVITTHEGDSQIG